MPREPRERIDGEARLNMEDVVSIRKIIDEDKTAPEALLHERHIMAYDITLERLSEGDTVLEIGHGDGYGLMKIAEKADIIGLDIDPRIVQFASEKYGEKYFKIYDGSSIPFDDNHFDCVCLFQVIEHIEEDVEILKEIRRVLKPGGFMIMTTPNRVLRVPLGEKPWNIEHVREYYPEELQDIMVVAGYSKTEVLGIDADDDYRSVELDRICKARKLRRLDPFRLRKYVPEQLLYQIGRRIVRKGKTAGESPPSGHFFVTETDLYRSLDLVGIGVK